MTTKDRVNAFFKICMGIAIVFSSIGFIFFSVKFNPTQAGTPSISKVSSPTAGYVPVGIEIVGGNVIVYGYNGAAEQSDKIKILARKGKTLISDN